MHAQDFQYFSVPGLNGSCDQHWQTQWERLNPDWIRIEQDDWSVPDIDRWSRRISQVLDRSSRPPIVVAHSFGCLATIHAIALRESWVAGALLVAPADPKKFELDVLFESLKIDCTSILVASENDPWMYSHRAHHWANHWGAELINIGAKGHINVFSGLGKWEQGLDILAKLTTCIATSDITEHVLKDGRN